MVSYKRITLIQQKFLALGCVFEGKQLCEESYVDICREVANCELLESNDPNFVDEHVD